jgi:hypothetical protein
MVTVILVTNKKLTTYLNIEIAVRRPILVFNSSLK